MSIYTTVMPFREEQERLWRDRQQQQARDEAESLARLLERVAQDRREYQARQQDEQLARQRQEAEERALETRLARRRPESHREMTGEQKAYVFLGGTLLAAALVGGLLGGLPGAVLAFGGLFVIYVVLNSVIWLASISSDIDRILRG